MTRIIAGRARGRRLAVPSSGTRPTSDRVREAVFSALDSAWRDRGTTWADVVALDLFAGSGALGLEALSRGARAAVLVERSRSAARTITENVATVGCSGATVLVRDVTRLPGTPPPAGPGTLILADPPYGWGATELAGLLGELADAGWIADDAVVVVERPTRDDASPLPAAWTVDRRRPYGDTTLWYGRAGASAEPGEDAD